MEKFNKIKFFIISALPHILVSAFPVIIVLSVTDFFNSAMAFINNDITKKGLIALSLIGVIIAVINILCRFKLKQKQLFIGISVLYICFCLAFIYLAFLGLTRPELSTFTNINVKRLVFAYSILSIAYSVLTIKIQRNFL